MLSIYQILPIFRFTEGFQNQHSERTLKEKVPFPFPLREDFFPSGLSAYQADSNSKFVARQINVTTHTFILVHKEEDIYPPKFFRLSETLIRDPGCLTEQKYSNKESIMQRVLTT